jgi:hypothetical protein
LVHDDSRREGDEHATSAAKPSPSRPFCISRAPWADSSVGANEAVGARKCAPGRDPGGGGSGGER